MADRRPLDIFQSRRNVLFGAGALVWTGLLGRLAQLQLIDGEALREKAADNEVRFDLAPPTRGRILDRFGFPLADHRQAGRVAIIREQAGDMEAVLAEIAKTVDLSPERQAAIIRRSRAQPAFLQTEVARELTYEEFARLSVHAAQLPGIVVEIGDTRSYTRGRDFAHVLGYVARASQKDINALTLERLDLTAAERRLLSEIEYGEWDHHTAIGRAIIGDKTDIRRNLLATKWSDVASEVNRLYKHPDMRTGRSGVEATCNSWLTGTRGSRAVVTNAAGRIIERVPDADRPPVAGRDVALTIDSELQRAAINRFGDETGACVVMDIENGDILSLVSTPAFDPNDFVNGISHANYDVLRNNPDAPLYHKAFDGVYPPGSTFKMVVAAAAMEAGVISPRERIWCNGRYRLGSRTWSCWKPEGHGAVNMHDGIKKSCDVYFYEIARRTGVDKIADVARRFGFGRSWGHLGLTGGARGVVPDPAWKEANRGEPWQQGETLNYGIGQGFLNTTPLQLALMTAQLARNGRPLAPQMLGIGPGFSIDTNGQGALDEEIISLMRDGMFGVTSEAGGTALRSGDLGLGGVRMAGKTGTAQVRYISQAERRRGVIKNEDLERRLRDHALFVGYAPHDDPKLAISVIIEHGGSGSRAAGPVARDVMAEALRLDSRRDPAWQRLAGRPSLGAANGDRG
ncbi:MAG: penicillin-binding protein 2 [Pseudomonadota bacterium]